MLPSSEVRAPAMNAFESRPGRSHGEGVPFPVILGLPDPPPGKSSVPALETV